MKKQFFFKAVCTVIMCGSISMASAKDIYLSSAGADTNDGSVSAPVKTLSKAFTISAVGDVIHVTSMININEEPVGTGARATIDIAGVSTTLVLVKDGVTYTTWNASNGTLGIIPHTRSLTIVGDDKASCGFDGNNASCIIRQDHGQLGANNGGVGVPGITVISYKNLTFKNGKSNDASGGGGFYFRGADVSSANIENCDFSANSGYAGTALKGGGALAIIHGVASVKKCSFTENVASKGAALYMQGGNVVMDSCRFENNDLSATVGSVGAAITVVPTSPTFPTMNFDIKNSLFKNNKAEKDGGALWVGGETQATNITNIRLTNCAFVENTTSNVGGLGGAVFVNNLLAGTKTNVSFINTTFKGNQAGANTGGAVVVYSLLANSMFDMINCTVSGNKVTGAVGAGGAGVRFLKASAGGVRKIQNCIIENNTAVDLNMANAIDYGDVGMEEIIDPVTFVGTPTYTAGTNLIIEKSIIGMCNNMDFATQFPLINANYVFALNGSIANSYVAKLGAFNTEMNYFPLLAGSPAIGYGNSSALLSLTPAVTTDQIGRTRPATTCSAGAYEFETILGIANNRECPFAVYSANNSVVVSGEGMTGQQLSIYSIDGKTVKSMLMTSNQVNIPVNKGFYIVKSGANSVKVLVN